MQGYFGIYRGTVVNNADPEHLGRLLLQVPAVTGFRQSSWAASSRPAGAAGALPDPGAAVWVMYESGDTTHPVWVGVPGWAGSAGPVTTMTLDTLTVLDSVTLPAGSLTVATTAGLQAALDSKYSAANPPPLPPPPDLSPYVTLASAQTITGQKRFSSAGFTAFDAGITSAGADSLFGAGAQGAVGPYVDVGSLGSTDGWVDARGSYDNVNLQLRAKGTGQIVLNNSTLIRGALAYGPNSSGKYLYVGAGGPNADSAAVVVSNGNLHLDASSTAGSSGIFLNWYNGASSGGVHFGNGAGVEVAAVDKNGAGTFASLYDSGNRVYSASNPPPANPANVAKTGDTMTGTLTVPYLQVNPENAGAGEGGEILMKGGTGQPDWSFDIYTSMVRLWRRDTSTTVFTVDKTGRVEALGAGVYDNGNRVYSAGNPPTAPTNMVTTDGVQTITAAKTFSGAFTAVNAAALSVGTGAPNIGTPKGIMDIVLGNGSSTNAYTSAETSGGLRFNGAGVYWGDLGYYPNGGTTGEFRFLRSNNAFVDGAGGYAKVRGDFYDASGNPVYSASNPPPASGMTVLGGQQAVTNASSTNTSSAGITFVAPASGRVVIRGAAFPPVVASVAIYDFSASLDNSTWYTVAVESRLAGSSASIIFPNAYGQATFTGLTPGATYTVYYKSPSQLSVSISYSVEG